MSGPRICIVGILAVCLVAFIGCGSPSSEFESTSGGGGSTWNSGLVTGFPDQNSFSVAAETLNPEGNQFNNIEVPVIMTVGGRLNNPTPGSTTIYFVAEGGLIDPSCTTDETGVCTATWRSSDPRPADGRATILAYSVGEESFTDVNNNGVFDTEDRFDRFSDVGEAYLDVNENGRYDFGEPFFDFDRNGKYTPANGIYNGTLCATSAQNAGRCTTQLVQVQDSITIVMSGSQVQIAFTPAQLRLGGGGAGTVKISLSDINGQPPPAGTAVEAETTNGSIAGESSFTVPNTNWPGPVHYYITIVDSADAGGDPLAGGGGDDVAAGILTVTATTPMGIQSSGAIEVLD